MRPLPSQPVEGPAPLAAATCRRHLALLEAGPAGPAGAGPDACVGVSWLPAPAAAPGAPGPAGGELVVQALSGLMAVHGRHRGRPAPLGLEVCSVAAGILAAPGPPAAGVASP